MKNFNHTTPENGISKDNSSEAIFLSDDHIENQISLNQDSEIDFLLDQYSGETYIM